MKRSCLSFLALLILSISFAQTFQNDNYLPWSSTRKLTANDFAIKTGNQQNASSYGQFSMQYEMDGFAFMKKSFNKNVHNYFLKSASWIDTSYDSNLSVSYQQTLFDICEIYTRQFRKALKENKRKFIKGNDLVNALNAKSMADFANRRLEYDSETRSGTDTAKQLLWEGRIQKELEGLKEFSNGL